MKKKISHIIVFVLSFFIVMCPMVVKADMLQLKSDAYSKYVSVGSEFIYAIKVGQNNFSGVVTFDNTALEVAKVETIYSGTDDMYGGNKGIVSKNVSGNKLNVEYTAGDYPEDILVTFKVKSYPNNGTTTVKVKSNSNLWFGEPENTMNVIAEKTCPVCEKDETSCPVCEETTKSETNNDVIDNNQTSDVNKNTNSVNNNTLLYVSLGACGILAIAVVILAFKRK